MTDQTTDPVEAVAKLLHGLPPILKGFESGWQHLDRADAERWRLHARDVIAVLTALGAAMPDEADTLRADDEIAERAIEDLNDEVLKATRRYGRAEAEVAALRAQVADALALCREIRPDSVIGTSPQVRLKLIEDRLAMPVGGPDAR